MSMLICKYVNLYLLGIIYFNNTYHWGKADVESDKIFFCRLNCFYNVF